MQEWITREAALAALGVRAQTLYAYVSRGLVTRRADPVDPRRSHYRGEDILALVKRRKRGRGAAAIASSAIAWGEPVIPTAISTVSHGRLILRGHDAVQLAGDCTLEQVAALLWQCPDPPDLEAKGKAGDPFMALAAMVASARPTIGRPAERLHADATAAVATLVTALGAVGEGPVHRRLARHWQVKGKGKDLLRCALVLLADHELNPSTFAVRVAAATGASLPASLLAGLGALSGPRHGGAGAAMAALAAEAERDGAAIAVTRWLAAGHRLPGFGHPLYPHGDPRAAALLDRLTLDARMVALRDAVTDAIGVLPNIDFAAIALTRHLGLPPTYSFTLFGIGRSVGWAAHAMEQALSGAQIRPRARYSGALPD